MDNESWTKVSIRFSGETTVGKSKYPEELILQLGKDPQWVILVDTPSLKAAEWIGPPDDYYFRLHVWVLDQ